MIGSIFVVSIPIESKIETIVPPFLGKKLKRTINLPTFEESELLSKNIDKYIYKPISKPIPIPKNNNYYYKQNNTFLSYSQQ